MSFWEIWHLFSHAPLTNFLWCYYRWLITYLGIENVKEECNMCSIILVQGFCPLKIKITQFLMDSVLIIVTSTYSSNFLSVDKIVRWPLNGHKHGECFHTVMFNYSVWYRPNSWKSTILQFHEKKEERLGHFVAALPSSQSNATQNINKRVLTVPGVRDSRRHSTSAVLEELEKMAQDFVL